VFVFEINSVIPPERT